MGTRNQTGPGPRLVPSRSAWRSPRLREPSAPCSLQRAASWDNSRSQTGWFRVSPSASEPSGANPADVAAPEDGRTPPDGYGRRRSPLHWRRRNRRDRRSSRRYRLSRNDAVGDGVRPHPNPLPQAREPPGAAPGTVTGWRTYSSVGEASPSPWGEGRGEGDRCISTA
jgi:hypothetical protein